jgi:hypothetical protein
MQNITLKTFCQISGIGAASGLFFKYDSLFIISDNSTFLYQYDLLGEKLTKIELFEDSQDSIVKKTNPILNLSLSTTINSTFSVLDRHPKEKNAFLTI